MPTSYTVDQFTRDLRELWSNADRFSGNNESSRIWLSDLQGCFEKGRGAGISAAIDPYRVAFGRNNAEDFERAKQSLLREIAEVLRNPVSQGPPAKFEPSSPGFFKILWASLTWPGLVAIGSLIVGIFSAGLTVGAWDPLRKLVASYHANTDTDASTASAITSKQISDALNLSRREVERLEVENQKLASDKATMQESYSSLSAKAKELLGETDVAKDRFALIEKKLKAFFDKCQGYSLPGTSADPAKAAIQNQVNGAMFRECMTLSAELPLSVATAARQLLAERDDDRRRSISNAAGAAADAAKK